MEGAILQLRGRQRVEFGEAGVLVFGHAADAT
jgi:hypothetical protein